MITNTMIWNHLFTLPMPLLMRNNWIIYRMAIQMTIFRTIL